MSRVYSFWWVRGLADFRSEAAELPGHCYSSYSGHVPSCLLLLVFVVSLASGVKLQNFPVIVTAHKRSADPKSEQQQDLFQRVKEQSFHSMEGNHSGLPLLAPVASFYSLIWPRPHPADWSIYRMLTGAFTVL